MSEHHLLHEKLHRSRPHLRHNSHWPGGCV